MPTIHPWINFNGNALDAFTFYQSVFGGEIAKKYFENGDTLMFISLPIGNHTTLMANDVPASMGRVNENENRSKILVQAESKEEADNLFAGLSAGGAVEEGMGESPWGSYFGMFRDKYGIEWMVEFAAMK